MSYFTSCKTDCKQLDIKENSKWMDIELIAWSLFSRNKAFVTVVKIYAKAVFQTFYSCPFLLDFFTFLQIFGP